jgi:RNA 2',3'-cyclic 3'-phosphodiesterase
MRKIFYGLTIESKLAAEFRAVVEQGQSEYAKSVAWVKPSNLHLTVCFVGYVEDVSITSFYTKFKSALDDLRHFPIKINEIAAFPNTKSNLIAAICEPCISLSKLHSRLTRFCSAMSGSLDSHTFRPHITLGRRKNPDKIVLRPIMTENITVNITEVALYESKTGPNNQDYRVIQRDTLHS